MSRQPSAGRGSDYRCDDCGVVATEEERYPVGWWYWARSHEDTCAGCTRKREAAADGEQERLL